MKTFSKPTYDAAHQYILKVLRNNLDGCCLQDPIQFEWDTEKEEVQHYLGDYVIAQCDFENPSNPRWIHFYSFGSGDQDGAGEGADSLKESIEAGYTETTLEECIIDRMEEQIGFDLERILAEWDNEES